MKAPLEEQGDQASESNPRNDSSRLSLDTVLHLNLLILWPDTVVDCTTDEGASAMAWPAV